METFSMIYLFGYMLAGIALTMYWWNTEYEKTYQEAKTRGEGTEDAMANIFMICLIVFWPIKLIKNLIVKHTI